MLSKWATALMRAPTELPAPPPPSSAVATSQVPVVSRSQPMVLQNLAHAAPAEFCCALDGQLTVDPVQSPYGHVFERSNLIEAMRVPNPSQHAPAVQGGCAGFCTLSERPLQFADCVRLPDLRRRIAQWIR